MLLEVADHQRVDVTASVVKVSATRRHTTALGERLIVDVTIRDASGSTGASECQFALFFPASTAGQRALEEFNLCHAENIPVAFFDLCIQKPDGGGPTTLRPHRDDFHWQPARTGEKAAQLVVAAQVLQSTEDANRIAEIPEFVPQEKVDYLAP